ncbi:hypothetical protein QVG61_13495 [Thiohalobacter sp. IOR34]|uniref:hypothetical protein n=1 Tax=Thiohalobacter sp. IOR34 TaxID=3057176 RepID=UPI0025AEEC27|nr:hypothetical protein [Thiohalobacter sp. IOR34]WJW75485.1 hypothetical protein QVG61_13495 [Thiohalobacter sp. IOR34]
MCFHAGNDELETVYALMRMSLHALIADTLSLDMEALSPELDLRTDLHMTDHQAGRLTEGVADMFDGLILDLAAVRTIADLTEAVTAAA